MILNKDKQCYIIATPEELEFLIKSTKSTKLLSDRPVNGFVCERTYLFDIRAVHLINNNYELIGFNPLKHINVYSLINSQYDLHGLYICTIQYNWLNGDVTDHEYGQFILIPADENIRLDEIKVRQSSAELNFKRRG